MIYIYQEPIIVDSFYLRFLNISEWANQSSGAMIAVLDSFSVPDLPGLVNDIYFYINGGLQTIGTLHYQYVSGRDKYWFYRNPGSRDPLKLFLGIEYNILASTSLVEPTSILDTGISVAKFKLLSNSKSPYRGNPDFLVYTLNAYDLYPKWVFEDNKKCNLISNGDAVIRDDNRLCIVLNTDNPGY